MMKKKKIITKVVNNYMSVGIDAKVALLFHKQREENPELFSSRTINKMWYVKFGVEGMIEGCPNLQEHIEVELDGTKIELPPLECIVIVNLPSCYGGAYLWPDTERPMHIGDGKFELVGLTGAAHLGQVQTGLAQPIVIGQGSEIKITMNQNYPVQVDGEPWEQEPCTLFLKHHNKVGVLANTEECHWVVKEETKEN